jgi:signal transduction histidine kinase/ActR/RegA family two-component response regulator
MNIDRKLNVLARRKLPVGMRKISDIFFVSFCICSLLGLTGISIWFNYVDNSLGLISTLLCAFGVALALGMWCLRAPWTLVTTIYQSALLSQILFNACITGGVTSPALGWLAIVPLLPLFTMPRSWANAWMSISFLSVIVLYVIQISGGLVVITQWLNTQPHMYALGHMDSSKQEMTFGASMFALMVIAQMILVKTYDAANTHFIHQLQTSNQRLEKLSAKLLLANTHKDTFLAMVSHEMRTPLNAVMGYLGLIGADSDLSEINSDYVQGARNSAAHLVTVISDLLDFSQIQQGKMMLNTRATDLQEALSSTHQTLTHKAKELSLDYQLILDDSLPAWVEIDSHRLAQILINILDNALKFTTQGRVHTRAWFEPLNDSSGLLFVRVQDTGTGIPKESIDLIFEPFVQLQVSDNHLRSGHALHGNGLGLAITKSLVHSHQGQIDVQSQVGIGSLFTVKIPVRIAQPPSSSHDSLNMPHISQLKLLIVDDHATNRMVASATIKRSLPDAQIEQAINGSDAIHKMSTEHYDLVLMDLIMPDYSGVEVVQYIKAHTQRLQRDVPVIALTANVAHDAIKECLDAGMVQVLPKPFERSALIDAILRHARQANPA